MALKIGAVPAEGYVDPSKTMDDHGEAYIPALNELLLRSGVIFGGVVTPLRVGE